MQTIGKFFTDIWNFIVTHALNIWAAIAAAIITVLSLFNIGAPGWLAKYTTTTPVTTIVETTTKAPRTFTISLTDLENLGCTLRSNVEIRSYNSKGEEKGYMLNGYRLKDVLQALGADISAIKSTSTLVAAEMAGTTVKYSAEITGDIITSDDSYLAIEYSEGVFASLSPTATKSGSKCPRLFPAPNMTVSGQSGLWVNNGLCNSSTNTLVLTYN